MLQLYRLFLLYTTELFDVIASAGLTVQHPYQAMLLLVRQAY